MKRVMGLFVAGAAAWLSGCSGSPGESPPERVLVRREVVFFASDRANRLKPGDAGTAMDVWVMDSDGSNPRQVTRFTEGDYWPADVSPDGRTLLFHRMDDFTFESAIYTLDLTQEEAQPQRVPVPESDVMADAFFPDGERILYNPYVSGPQGGYEGLFTFNLRTGERRAVTPAQLGAARGAVSRDGEWVCYGGFVTPIATAIYVSKVDGSARRALTPEADGNAAIHCAFSADGSEVVLVFDIQGQNGYNLYRVHLETGERRVIRAWEKPGDIDYYAHPVVDSAGAKVYMRINGGHRPDERSEIAVVNLDGTGFRQLMDDRRRDDQPVVANAYVWEDAE